MRIWRMVAALVAALSIGAGIVWHDASHAYFWWHRVPGFDLLFGFAGCVAIVVISKALGAWWLQRPEKYWDDAP